MRERGSESRRERLKRGEGESEKRWREQNQRREGDS